MDFEEKLKKDILQEILVPISFENAIQEALYKGKKTRNTIKIIRDIAAMGVILFFVGSVGILAHDYFKQSTLGFVPESLQNSAQSGYIDNVVMDYKYSNGVGMKINYIIMSDYNLNFLIECKSSKEVSDREIDIKDMIIYDEEDTVLFCYDSKTYKEYCKRKSISYSKEKIEQATDGYGIQLVEKNEEMNKTLYTLRSKTKFPKSKKIFIEFNKMGAPRSKNTINGNWKMELELPEKFYNRTNIKYGLMNKEEIEKSGEISNVTMEVSNTIMNVGFILKDSNGKGVQLYLVDQDNKRYEVNKIENSISINNNSVNATFSMNKENLPEKLMMYLMVQGKEYRLELEKE